MVAAARLVDRQLTLDWKNVKNFDTESVSITVDLALDEGCLLQLQHSRVGQPLNDLKDFPRLE